MSRPLSLGCCHPYAHAWPDIESKKKVFAVLVKVVILRGWCEKGEDDDVKIQKGFSGSPSLPLVRIREIHLF